ncbi:MAG: hypothetical protein M1832_001123 [Thelocarpon impressellum]|nr:MAG: hypothetical protein M1832_001123 [Thelocarpon impressellum]
MAGGRKSSGGIAVPKRTKARRNPQKRSQEALAIATKQAPERLRVRHHRLGEAEGGQRGPKRRNGDDGEQGPEADEARGKRRRLEHGGASHDDLDVVAGSDSEGNEWRLGHVDPEEDSELDSDEAMGESDEERFEGFVFRGSSSTKSSVPKRKGKPRGRGADPAGPDPGDIDLNEGPSDNPPGSSGSDDDDLGEGTVDLAAMLDATEEEDPSSRKDTTTASGLDRIRSPGPSDATLDTDDEEDDIGAESDSVFSDEDTEDVNVDPAGIAALQDLVASLAPDADSPPRRQKIGHDALEFKAPSDFGLTSSQKLTVSDLLPSVTDATLQKSLKLLSADSTSKGSKRSGGIPAKLDVPLAKRQQDRLDRAAAYEESKETLNRWIDTVKHNRRAEHLTFPLVRSDDVLAHGKDRLVASAIAPVSKLENTIQSILERSGLSTAKGGRDEDKIQEFEELQTNKLPLEEVEARRAQLRMARELLFREEVRAKRIKKIKSKSYRRVHRKQRERDERDSKAALAAAGVELSEDEREAADRRRAHERMGAKHRESTWAKGVKASGRAAWDVDARVGVTEMARRGEDLRKRIEGKPVRTGDDDEIGSTSDDTDDIDGPFSNEEPTEKQKRKLLDRLDRVEELSHVGGHNDGPGSNISSMKFMQRAEAARKAENDAAAKALKRELAGEDSSDGDEGDMVGRRKYGPRIPNGDQPQSTQKTVLGEFEDPLSSDGDVVEQSERPASGISGAVVAAKNPENGHPKGTQHFWPFESGLAGGGLVDEHVNGDARTNPFRDEKQIGLRGEKAPGLSSRDVRRNAPRQSNAPGNPNLWTTVTVDRDPESDDEGESEELEAQPTARTQQALRMRAFAGDEVVRDFEMEKKKTMEEEDEQVVDTTLPGWGTWTGSGISKKEQKRNGGRFIKKTEGIKPDKRKDSKLDRVIINEKRVKKNTKYLASSLPHPFETRQQYERSLRLPVGPEWTTKETFQDATKPRVMVKQGIIAPIEKPIL